MNKEKSHDACQDLQCDNSYASSNSDSASDDSSGNESPAVNTQSNDDKLSHPNEVKNRTTPSFTMTMKSSAVAKQPNAAKGQPTSKLTNAFRLSISTQKNSKISENSRVVTTVASIFNEDESEEVEQMPPEAKMRMRNLGKDTPTAAGPNSFSKGKMGFCNAQKVLQRELEKSNDEPVLKKKKF